jgi:hypothetical protein
MVRDYDDYNRRATGSNYDYRPRLRDAHFLGSDVVSDRYDGPRKHHWSNDAARNKAALNYLEGLGW